jgi:hypothetical protein
MTGDLNNRGKAYVKTWNGKWNGMKNGAVVDKLGCIDLLDAITHVEIGKTIKCVPYNISYGYSISFHYSFCFLFFCSVRVLANTQKFVSTYNIFHMCFFHFEGYLVKIIIVTS